MFTGTQFTPYNGAMSGAALTEFAEWRWRSERSVQLGRLDNGGAGSSTSLFSRTGANELLSMKTGIVALLSMVVGLLLAQLGRSGTRPVNAVRKEAQNTANQVNAKAKMLRAK